jgi:hypothetical protein
MRNAMIAKGAATDITLCHVIFKNIGCYIWEDADASLQSCTILGGLHGVYAWGKCTVTVTDTAIEGTEKSGVCIRDGTKLTIKVRLRKSHTLF